MEPGDDCRAIQPLLSLYSDKMTAPAESARVEAHLPECEDCRRSLSWMQATNAVLAHREPVMPPPDMALRIRGAIAELEAGQRARPTRAPLVYRPAFASAFTILIGAVVVAQITLRSHHATPIANRQVAANPSVATGQIAAHPSVAAPPVSPSPLKKPSAPAVVSIHHHADVKVAKRLPLETALEGHVGNDPPQPALTRIHRVDIAAIRPPKPLREVSVHSETHEIPAPLVVVKTRPASHVKHQAPAAAPPTHNDEALMASRDTNPHDGAPPKSGGAPAPIPETSPQPDAVRVATVQTRGADVLSGVRTKVAMLQSADYMLPSSARSADHRRTFRGMLDIVYIPDKPKPRNAPIAEPSTKLLPGS